MTWTELVILYILGVSALATCVRHLFVNRLGRMIRTLLFGGTILLLGDIIAEQRRLWLIPKPMGGLLLGAPAENFLLATASLLLSLILYLLLAGRSQRYSDEHSKSTQPSQP